MPKLKLHTDRTQSVILTADMVAALLQERWDLPRGSVTMTNDSGDVLLTVTISIASSDERELAASSAAR